MLLAGLLAEEGRMLGSDATPLTIESWTEDLSFLKALKGDMIFCFWMCVGVISCKCRLLPLLRVEFLSYRERKGRIYQ